MAVSMTSGHKNCATCNYWAGSRTLGRDRDRAEYAGNSVKGECAGGGHDRQQRPADGSCGKWIKWSALR